MPVYWFALSQTSAISTSKAILLFIILHFLAYPASNGYNSYMDCDTESIGGIEKPPLPGKQLFWVSLILDILALICSLWISLLCFGCLLAYILASRAYSYRGIRLKKYPFIGFLTVIVFQGSLIYFLVKTSVSQNSYMNMPWLGMLVSALLVGGFYPLTQIYQHKQDQNDGVRSLSSVLGYKPTFWFTAVIFTLSMVGLAIQLNNNDQLKYFWWIQPLFIPVLAYFFWWYNQVRLNILAANYTNTMRMNLLASVCSNASFFTLLMLQ